jgi:hypothetical protein
VSDLQEFQAAAVQRICDQLNAENGSRRFLLADEVGLGKTMVARGVIDELRERSDSRKGSVCVYLCSNLEIADQNQNKLNDAERSEPPTRLTLIPLRAAAIHRARARKQPQLFVFTPGTSLHLGGATGIKSERKMLLACLYGWKPHKIGAKLSSWIEFFRCGAGQQSKGGAAAWIASCAPAELRREIAAMEESGLYRKMIGRWSQAKVSLRLAGEGNPSSYYVLDAIYHAVAEMADCPNDAREWRRVRKNRNILIGELRKGVAEAAIDFLAPDLVLVDEFQRFKEIIDLSVEKGELACRLFAGAGKAPRVLILSATPYKAVTFDHEQEDHYKDFNRTLSFLLADRPDKTDWLKDVDGFLLDFKKNLTGDSVELPALIELKDKLERLLKQVMCRTERNRYIFDEDKGVQEIPDFYLRETLPAPDAEALAEFVSLRSFLQKHEKGERPFPSIIDFWKSCSSVISFMDAGYVLIKRLRDEKVRIDSRLLRQESDLKGLGRRNLKVQTLASRIRESAGTTDEDKGRWRFLWVRPTYYYYRDGFFRDADPTKFLVFSRWRFVPKAISFVVSSEFEAASLQRRKPNKQALELNSECLKVCAPLVALADLVDPAAWSAAEQVREGKGPPPTAQLRRHVRVELKRRLAEAGIAIVKNAPRKSYWPALFALERWHLRRLHAGRADQAKASPISEWDDVLAIAVEPTKKDAEGSEQAEEFLDRVQPWVAIGAGAGEVQPAFPAALLEDAITMVLGSPAISVMRATRSLYGNEVVDDLGSVARTCFQHLRSFFNKGYVQETIRRHARSGRYADQVLRYSFDAHFQSVIDEYAYLVRNVLQRAKLPKFLEHIGRVLSVGAGTPNINVPTARSGQIREKRSQRPVNFALAFGEESQSDDSEASRASRKTGVREAFNSPFWPFVLATTSIGQEGLDFHLYCRDVMHWNLPANPVDLEQREGRINRFDGMVVRRNIAIDYPLASIGSNDASPRNYWGRVFEEIKVRPTGKQHFKHGLFPHWIFEPVSGKPIRLRRHLAIFEGSRDRIHYERLKKYLFYYRLAFGQARQQDLLDKIVDRPNEERLRKDLQACMINLSPFDETYSWKKAQADAAELLNTPDQVESLIEETKTIFETRRGELHEVTADLEALWNSAKRVMANGNASTPEEIRAIAALIYLQNPFDERFDGLIGDGLTDDVKIIRKARDAD